MSLHKALNDIAGGLVDLHVGLNRARYFATELSRNTDCDLRYVHDLYDELAQMQMDVERLMKEVE